MKILIAGFQHETNTFAPTRADYDSFVRGEGFPALRRGAEVLALREVNIPAGGFIRAAEARGHALLPVIWAGASPSAHVTREAYERIAGEILDAVRAGGFEAIYLDLHGAMVAEHVDDGEGELLERIRRELGAGVPVIASLDLHANVTARMLRDADLLVAYRSYPHVDMAETGERALHLLERLAASPAKPVCVARGLPFLIPVNAMCTRFDPARALYQELARLEHDDERLLSLSFAPGFPAADFPECGPMLWGYGIDADPIERRIEALARALVADESSWRVDFLSPDQAVRAALHASVGATRPVIIADTQDNPGAGGDANTMELVRALLRNGAREAAVGMIWDPRAVRLAHQAGVGASIELALGGSQGRDAPAAHAPLTARFEVAHLSDGRFRFDGPMMNGMDGELGPVACLRIEDVEIAVSATKMQMFERNQFRCAGIDPERRAILVVKSSVHFRADFESIAHTILVAKAPGPMAADPGDLPWRRLRAGMRVRPGGPAFARADALAATR
ncbi:M81 family metallopeptidase [Burkholderia gladioli]|uniref:M81 family metallopeptidase n=1 Tax=Burkholderia gladioli TaxID=28095 RepID=UPI00163EE154|nr:M81 family metallopeptidase [Burkholderia gladioli]MDN7721184.1 M81 family metallopeptidase [Burkholderia gladioli]